MSVTGSIVAGVGAASAIGGAAISANAAGNAASAQANSANYAANLQKQAADESLAFQKQQYAQNQQNFAPWLSAGKGALTNLQYLLGIPNAPGAQGSTSPNNSFQSGGGLVMPPGHTPVGAYDPSGNGEPSRIGNARAIDGGMMRPYSGPGAAGAQDGPVTQTSDGSGGQTPTSATTGDPQLNTNLGSFGQLLQPWTEQFQAPTAITEQNDPGYQARLKLGTDALQKSAAARGGVLTGGTAKDLTNYAQDYGSNEYGNVYARGWNDYTSRYNNFQNNNANTFNRLAAISGVGQTTANQLGMMGQNAANGISSTLLNSAGMIGQQANNAAAARGSGYVGTANAINQGIGGVNSSLQNYLLLQQLNGASGAAAAPFTSADVSICWIAAELYGGWNNPRTKKVRTYLTGDYRSTPMGRAFVDSYEKNGERVAELAKTNPELKDFLRPIFDHFLTMAEENERREKIYSTRFES